MIDQYGTLKMQFFDKGCLSEACDLLEEFGEVDVRVRGDWVYVDCWYDEPREELLENLYALADNFYRDPADRSHESEYE
jgi:hypothetical protein